MRHPAQVSRSKCPWQEDGREKAAPFRTVSLEQWEQGGQLGVGSRDETLEGGHCCLRGNRGGRNDQATAQLRQEIGSQLGNTASR